MQAKTMSLRTVVAVLFISLVLGACSGGGAEGSTWFNLPSIPVNIDQNGNGTVFGFSVGPVLQQPLLGQLQQANVQQLEIRLGYHGIFVYANGQPLPYLAWDEQAITSLQEVLRNTPGAQQAAGILPWFRRVGVGVALKLPLASGATPLEIPRWRGEELAQPEQPGETTIGPIKFASLAYDAQGNPTIEGVPLAELEQALGTSFGLNLPANAQTIIQALGLQFLRVQTQPNGIDLSTNGPELPDIAYDTTRLNNLQSLAQALVADPNTAQLVETLVPQLPGAEVELVVSFTGQPVEDTQLTPLPIQVAEDGSLSLWGIALPGASLPADLVAKFQDGNVQKLDASLAQDTLYAATNREPLPALGMTDFTVDTLANVADDLAGVDPKVVDAGLRIVRSLTAKTQVGVSMDLPPAPGAEPLTFEGPFDVTAVQFEPLPPLEEREIADVAVSLDPNTGRIASLGGLPPVMMDLLGISGLGLPANLMDTLGQLQADALEIQTVDNTLAIAADGQPLLNVQYDLPAMDRAMGLATTFVGENEMLQQIQAILPEILTANTNVVVGLKGQPTPPAKLTAVPLPFEITPDGRLTLVGLSLANLPVDLVQKLQAAGVQRLDVDVFNDTLFLAANGEPMPTLAWTEDSVDEVTNLVGGLVGVPADTVGSALAFLSQAELGLAIKLPVPPGAQPLDMPLDFKLTSVDFQEPQLGDLNRPMAQFGLVIQDNRLTEIAGIPVDSLAAAGLPVPSLSPSAIEALRSLDAQMVQVAAVTNGLQLTADEQPILQMGYDTPALQRLVKLAMPFLPEQTAQQLEDPDVSKLLLEQLLTVFTGSEIKLTAVLE